MATRKSYRSTARKSSRVRSTRSARSVPRKRRSTASRSRGVSRRSAVSRTNKIVVQVVGVPQEAGGVATPTPNVQGLTQNVVRKPKVRRF